MNIGYKYISDGHKRNRIIVVLIILSLAVYFSISIYVLPSLYISTPKLRPLPLIINTKISAPQIRLGKTFYLDVTAENAGDNADIQIVSAGFPNLTSIGRYINIRQSDFTQKPLFVNIGDKVGSNYTGLENIVYAKYPSIEAFSRPWHSKNIHHIEFEVKPTSVGKFVIFLKTVALPHSGDFAHYPRSGIKDFQNEFVKVYSIEVLQT
ncbi:MAG TPA: hypothetical protein VE223_05670 [Nitrososphaeraceae archaeon]|nr:hypothetical protein [Nitrososphaeraceae archaeon]